MFFPDFLKSVRQNYRTKFQTSLSSLILQTKFFKQFYFIRLGSTTLIVDKEL